jgi:hypothetical protein
MKLLLLAAALSLGLSGQQNTVFRRNVFQGATTAQASSALPNIGQAVHIVTLLYPTASADVSSFTFRVEASYDNSTYFPIIDDITEAKYNGSYAYAVARCNGVYPYVRLRLVTANATYPLTAHYTGSLQPIGTVKFSADRYVLNSPLAGPVVEWPGVTIDGTYYVGNRRMTPITPGAWTSVNFVAETVRHDDTYSLSLQDPYNATTAFRLVCRSLPSAPYTIRLHVAPDYMYSSGDGINRTGFALRNSGSGAFVAWTWGGVNGSSFFHEKYNSPSSLNSAYNGSSKTWRQTDGPAISLQIEDDNTNRTWYAWNGKRKVSLYPVNSFWGTQVARTDFITPDQVCFVVNHDNGNYNVTSTFIGYDVNPTW